MTTQQTTLAFVGAGALGQAFAGCLAADQQQVTLLVSESRAEQLQRDRLVRLYGARELELAVAPAPASAGTIGITSDPARLAGVAGIIFTTKAHQLPAAIAALKRSWQPSTAAAWVAGAQNGLAKDTMLIDAFGSEHVVGMATVLSAQREPDRRINIRNIGTTYLGEFGSGVSPRVATASAILNRAGITTIAADDIQGILWAKACHAAGIFGTSAPIGASLPHLMASADLTRVYLALLRESATIAAAYGIALRDYPGFPVRTYLDQPDDQTIAQFAANAAAMRANGGNEPYSSMAYDAISGRTLEVDEVFGDLVVRAERAGVAAPRLTLIRDLLRGVSAGT